MPTVCPHCGARSPETAEYCAGCGVDRGPAGAAPTPTVVDTPGARSLDVPHEPSWPTVGPPPSPPRPARTDGFRLWVTLAVIFVLVAAGITTGVLLKRGGGDRSEKQTAQEARPGPSASSSAPAAASSPPASAGAPDPANSQPAQDASASVLPASGGLPPGFHRVLDAEGFTLGIMDGWQRRRPSATQVDYVAPTGPEYLRVGVIPGAAKPSYDNFLELERKARSREGYRRVELVHNTFQGRPAARWEFTYTSDGGGTVRAMDEAYVAGDGTEYALYFEVRDRLWDPATDQVFRTALTTWAEPHRE